MRAIVAGCLALGLLTAGCSSDPDSTAPPPESPSMSPSPSASVPPDGEEAATTSPSPSASPAASVPRPPRGANDRAGRVAFAEYVLQAWIYALNTNDPDPLVSASGQQPCTGCRQLTRELSTREKEGWYVELSGVRVSARKVDASGRSARVVLSTSLPESNTYDTDGAFRSSNPAHPRSTFEVEMTHTRRGFRLDSFSLY